jgi:hypothetical protein
MKKELFTAALKHGPGLLPGVFAFIKRWFWLLILGGIVFAILAVWLVFSVVFWAWDSLPHILSYVLNHFAPVWQNLPPVTPVVTEGAGV